MVRRVTPAQFRALVQKEEARQRRAINEYNAAARKYNSELKRAVDSHNSEVRKARQEVDRYNREARAHNARVRADRQRLAREIDQIERRVRASQASPAQRSSLSLHEAYRAVDAAANAEDWGSHGNLLVDLAETEAANSAAVSNVLAGDAAAAEGIESSDLTDHLSAFSQDLDSRWRGALFSLNPQNPDAARHFCTSAREIFTQILDISAPDDAVKAEIRDCRLTPAGHPIRRDKIRYLLARSSRDRDGLEQFVDSDIDDVVGLFRVFNDGTHGDAGAFDLASLYALRGRVEGAIRFLSTVARR
ncbi:MAG TPA: hypothetical protein VFU16_07535 [Solirubrobacterales bacterium]|nr:hypothetical protein [Solirubrobacterales bacterium]